MKRYSNTSLFFILSPFFFCNPILSLSLSSKEGWFFRVNFLSKITHLNCLSFHFYSNKWFHIYFNFFFVILSLVQCCVGRRLIATLFCFLVLVWCLFGLDWQISFNSMHIQSMILTSSMLQTQRHWYFGHFNFVIFVDFVTFVGILSLYAINMGVVSLFVDSFFSIYSDFEFIFRDVFYQFKWMCRKKKIQSDEKVSQ